MPIGHCYRAPCQPCCLMSPTCVSCTSRPACCRYGVPPPKFCPCAPPLGGHALQCYGPRVVPCGCGCGHCGTFAGGCGGSNNCQMGGPCCMCERSSHCCDPYCNNGCGC